MDYEFDIPTVIDPAMLPYIVADRHYLQARKSILETFLAEAAAVISYVSPLGEIVLDFTASTLAPVRQFWLENRVQVREFCPELRFLSEQVTEKPNRLQLVTDLTMRRGSWGFLGFMAVMIPAKIGIRICENWVLDSGEIHRGMREISVAGLPFSARQSWEYRQNPTGDTCRVKLQLDEIPYLGSRIDGEKVGTVGYNLLTLEEEIKKQWWGLIGPSSRDNRA